MRVFLCVPLRCTSILGTEVKTENTAKRYKYICWYSYRRQDLKIKDYTDFVFAILMLVLLQKENKYIFFSKSPKYGPQEV